MVSSISWNTATTYGILFKVEGFRIRHAIDDSLEISLLTALWAGEGAKCWAAFSGHLNLQFVSLLKPLSTWIALVVSQCRHIFLIYICAATHGALPISYISHDLPILLFKYDSTTDRVVRLHKWVCIYVPNSDYIFTTLLSYRSP